MTKDQKFLRLLVTASEACARAAQEAIARGEEWMVEDASMAKAKFDELAEQVRTGTLPPSQGSGLGITRALSEWAPIYLYSAGEAVEEFYSSNWRLEV